jgi:hypothetical protein
MLFEFFNDIFCIKLTIIILSDVLVQYTNFFLLLKLHKYFEKSSPDPFLAALDGVYIKRLIDRSLCCKNYQNFNFEMFFQAVDLFVAS